MADPKLKEAMAEIKAICRKHDIAGDIRLVSDSHSEFAYEFSPSWSVVSLQGSQLRIKAKRADFKTKAQQKLCVDMSIGMIHMFRDLNVQGFENMQRMVDMLGKHFDITHEAFADFEPHREN